MTKGTKCTFGGKKTQCHTRQLKKQLWHAKIYVFNAEFQRLSNAQQNNASTTFVRCAVVTQACREALTRQ